MPAAMGMIIIGVTTLIIKLVNEPDRQRTNDFNRQRRKKISSVYLISNIRSYDIRQHVYDDEQDRGDNKIAKLHKL